MARPLRIQYEGACYHVINRGNRRETVFYNPDDCEIFIEKLAYFADIYEVTIYSYCIMPNHFHIFLKTEHANLSKFMQSFLTSFTITINKKYQKSGHLFQGRYKAALVEDELYKNKLSRYIHLNPVKTKEYEGVANEILIEHLNEFKWSSYCYYLGIEKKPSWLNRKFILSSWGTNADEKIENYKKYVEAGIKTDNTEEVKAEKQMLASRSFAKKIVKRYLKSDLSDIDSREQPILASLNTYAPHSVILTVKSYYNLHDKAQITTRRNCNREARQLAIYLTSYYCRRNKTLTELAKIFGLKISGYNSAVDKFKLKLSKDEKLNCNVDKIIMELKNKNNKTEV